MAFEVAWNAFVAREAKGCGRASDGIVVCIAFYGSVGVIDCWSNDSFKKRKYGGIIRI